MLDSQERGLMQHALILTRIVPERGLDGALTAVSAVTHDGRTVRFQAQMDQHINLTLLEHQRAPLLLLTDRLYEPFRDMITVPGDALLSIVPLPAGHIRALLDRDEGDRLLEAVAVQLP
ncbi:hypothetical protein GCM10011352_38470 [Marinobacterium zhoushanense]|uniref:Uncharacterized protein n=1 Tax=Marinobacterium zhoushanense TaxID=1679163 RepID=A0ABQ1KT57_9GAMM|nr:hypothetical protein [Marinobacterium zhoushanense]GGC08458.1 hypothetical protein GCM10011352_38470 [Marinobacterium zhoushanense]